MEEVHKRRRVLLGSLFLNLSGIANESTPRKFAYIWRFQRTGINATKFEKTRIHFKSDIFAVVAVFDAKAV